MSTPQKKIKSNLSEPFVVSEYGSDTSNDSQFEGINNILPTNKEPINKSNKAFIDKTQSTTTTKSQSPNIQIIDQFSGIDLPKIDSSADEFVNQFTGIEDILPKLEQSTQQTVTQEPPKVEGRFINVPELWTPANDEDLAKIEYDTNQDKSFEEKFALAAFARTHPLPSVSNINDYSAYFGHTPQFDKNGNIVENPEDYKVRPETIPNPDRLLKSQPVTIPAANPQQYPSSEEVFEAYLANKAPNLIPFLKNFEAETGQPLAKGVVYGSGKWEGGFWNIDYQPTEGLLRAINAYAKGGLTAFNKEAKNISDEKQVFSDRTAQLRNSLEAWKKEHPYWSQFVYGIGHDTAAESVQLAHNAEYVSKAIETSILHGTDSPEYQALIDEDAKKQQEILQGQSYIPQPQTTGESLARVAGSTAGAFPKIYFSGEALPLLVFLEHANRGATEATRDAFMMLPMIGAGKLLGGYTANSVQAANFSLASRALRQAEVRFGQGATQVLSDFAFNPGSYLNGEKPFQVLENIDKEKSLTGAFRRGAGEKSLGSFLTGVAFPVGGVEGRPLADEFPLSTNVEDLGKYSPNVVKAQMEQGEYNPSQVGREGLQAAAASVPWSETVLNYIQLKRAKESGSYQTGDLQKDVDRLTNINETLEHLENILPKEWIDYVSTHEEAIRAAQQNGEIRRQFRAKAQAARENGEISSDTEKISTFDSTDWMKEGNEKFGGIGRDNAFVSQGNAARDAAATRVSLEQQKKIGEARASGQRGAIGGFTPESGENITTNKWYNENRARLSRIGAFYFEAGVRDFGEFNNRLQNDLGSEVYDRLGNERVREIYDEGRKFYESNIADPFFSGLKQNVIERFPDGNLNVKSARNVIARLGTANEIAWTTGLQEYLDNAERNGTPINKQKLIQVIQDGQVRVNEVVLGNKLTNQEIYEFDNLKSAEDADMITSEGRTRLQELRAKWNNSQNKSTRYDLETYGHGAGEKLELEGGREPREVLLQIPVKPSTDLSNQFLNFLSDIGESAENFIAGDEFHKDKIISLFMNRGGSSQEIYHKGYSSPDVFTHSHYPDFPNYFAHFRANFRTLMDGITKVFHSEEFQSDWNQRGRKEGYKGDENPRLREIQEQIFKLKPEAEKIGGVSFADVKEVLGADVAYEFENLVTQQKSPMLHQVPKNPFMENNWKELAFKRFLRMGVENDVDGVTWTTARQQQERYGKVAESKTLIWDKVGDNKYNLVLETPNGQFSQDKFKGISIDRVKELTNEETANRILKEGKRAIGPVGGTIELKDTLKLGSGYSDYDTYFVNLAKKIAKRFGGEYKIEQIETGKQPKAAQTFRFADSQGRIIDDYFADNSARGITETSDGRTLIPKEDAKGAINIESVDTGEIINTFNNNIHGPANYTEAQRWTRSTDFYEPKTEEVHFLSITPQMRESLKQGFPLYGIGLEDLPAAQQKTGIRNQIFPREEFDANLRDVVDSLSTLAESDNNNGIVFNSGLNPQAFAYQVRLLYKGFKDAASFTTQLISDYGDAIKPYTDKLWAFAQHFHENEGGFIINPFTGGREKEIKRMDEEDAKNFRTNLLYSSLRSITLATQNSTFGGIYYGMRDVRLTLNGYVNNLVHQINDARSLAGFKRLTYAADPSVPVAVYKGNEEGKVYSDIELQTRFGLSPQSIDSYKKIRQAQDNILNLRMQQELYHDFRLLANQTPNSPAHTATQTHIQATRDRYQKLKDSGYISLQRRGNIAIVAEDTSFPVGNPQRNIYVHAKNRYEANNIVRDFKRQEFQNITAKKLIKIRNDFNFMRRLTPGQIEDAIVSSGANPNSPEIKAIKDEIYSRYSSYSYNIQRNFTRGYKVTWKNMIDTLMHQARVYSSSFYSDVGRENAFDMLNQSGIQNHTVTSVDANGNKVTRSFSDGTKALAYKNGLVNHTNIKTDAPNPILYNVTKDYIEAETTPFGNTVFTSNSAFNRFAAKARALTYITQIGLDVSQFFNHLTQPITITYSHLASEPFNTSASVISAKPEATMLKAAKMTSAILGRGIGLSPKSITPEFSDILARANREGVLDPLPLELSASTLGESSPLRKVSTLSSIFVKAGRKVSQLHALSAAYLVGKEKGLAGNQLYDFAVDFVKQTHGEYTAGEVPRVIRQAGEVGKLFYQFGAFHQIWFESLAKAIKSDVNTKTFKGLAGGATLRHLGGLGVLAGVSGIPAYSLVRSLLAVVYGKDEEERFRQSIQDKLQNLTPQFAETLSNIALYGVSSKKGISTRLGIKVPVIDSLSDFAAGDTEILDSIPALSTAKQVLNAPKDLLRHEGFRFAEDLSPRAARNIVRAFRFKEQGARQRREFGEGMGDVIVPRGRLSDTDLFLQSVGVTPAPILNEYEKKKYEALGTMSKTTHKSLRRYFYQYFPQNLTER